jgi:dihydrofolate reductase
MLIIISAIGSNQIIGDGDGLPWHIPSEYNQFLGYVKDQTVLMGRRSYEIFKSDMLPKRMVVVSRSLKTDQASVFSSLPEALEYSKIFSEDVFICGGQSVYEESIQYADYMYLSFIKGEHQGNVYFPQFGEEEWSVEKKEEHDEFIFVIYKRKTELHEE